MSGILGNAPRHINISVWLKVIKEGISVPCSLYRFPGEIHALFVCNPSQWRSNSGTAVKKP